MTVLEVWAVAAAFGLAVAAPGPATLALMGTGMASGRAAALGLASGLAAGLAVWGVVAASGLGMILSGSATFLTVLRVLGGAYLLYLAWLAARRSLAPADDAGDPPALARPGSMVRRGLLLNLSNPKAALTWAALMALALGPETTGADLAMLCALCALVGGCVYGAMAILFSTRALRSLYARARRGIEAAFAALFTAAGLRLLAWRP